MCCLWRWWENVCGDGGCRVQVLMEMVGGVFVEMVGVVCRCLWRWWESVCGDGWCRVWFLVEMVGVVFVGMVGVVCRF